MARSRVAALPPGGRPRPCLLLPPAASACAADPRSADQIKAPPAPPSGLRHGPEARRVQEVRGHQQTPPPPAASTRFLSGCFIQQVSLSSNSDFTQGSWDVKQTMLSLVGCDRLKQPQASLIPGVSWLEHAAAAAAAS